jgi:hypothetical protein
MTASQPSARSGNIKLPDVERLRMLDQAINSRDRPVIRGMNFLVIHEPKIVIDRSTFSAVMLWGKTLTSPLVIVLVVALSFVTCGFFLPFWLVWTQLPNKFVQTIFIDKYGLQHWDIAPIPLAQRILSGWIVFGIFCWIAYMIYLWHSIKTL